MTDGRWLPSAIAADGLLHIPHRSCERLKEKLELLKHGRHGAARVRVCVRVNSALPKRLEKKQQSTIHILSCYLHFKCVGHVYCSLILRAVII